MRGSFVRRLALVSSLVLSAGARAQDNVPRPDFTKEPTLYVVGYAHLDTEWRWMYPQTIREFIPDTLATNFAYFDQYPSYVFNFSGSRRYQFMREYYPEQYETLKTWVAAGRWFPCGSSVDENDANVPSGESLIRHVLYGNHYFLREFGVASDEYMLPDCFGFPAALPSVLAHCGIQGFSTQKLTWNAVVPIPFKVGVWEGPDGKSVVAALDPGAYVGEVQENLANSDGWKKRIDASGKVSGTYVDYHYYGTGDQGGGPSAKSVAMVEESVNTKGALRVISGPADWMFKAITAAMRAKLPRYKGELQLTEHSAGSITSEGYMKRWNRKNELLADATERASVAAAWLGARAYPAQKLEDAWTLVLGSQMHDILPGTSHPGAYDYAWNDEVLAGNAFSAMLTDAVSGVSGMVDTQGLGTALVVFNPLSIEREDVVEADVDGHGLGGVQVVGPDGHSIPAQVLRITPAFTRIGFIARLPPMGFAAFDVIFPQKVPPQATSLSVAEHRLENERYVVKLGDEGDVTSIFDKQAQRELLSGPARLGLHYENPSAWPAWNQDWSDRQKPTREYVGGPAQFEVVESGPARVAVRVTRTLGSSTFVQTIRLAAGDAGNRVEFDTQIDWAQRERSLRAEFPLTVSNPLASYDLQVGVLERPVMHKEQYEYCSHQWFDLTDAKGDYGVTVMNDCKYGSDRPDDHTLRLTLLHTPGTRGGYEDQGTQDLGRHHVLYAIEGHPGDWRAGKSAQQAERLNQPLRVFRAMSHPGTLGKSFSLLRTSDDNVRITALKKAEDSDEIVVRLRELSGHDVKGVVLTGATKLISASEVDGQERDVGPAVLKDGALVTDMHGFGLRAFVIKLAPPKVTLAMPPCTTIELPYDTDVASSNARRTDGAMDAQGRTYPVEQMPATLDAEEAHFVLGPRNDGAKNAVTCRGQELALAPKSGADRLYLLAASSDGDVDTNLSVDGQPVPLRVNAWNGFLGQWDKRLWIGDVPEMAGGTFNALGGIEPGYIKPGSVAWWCSHHHTAGGDAYYQYCYLWTCAIDLPKGAKSVRLPKDGRIKVFAASAVTSGPQRVEPAAPLFDSLEGRAQDAPRVVAGDERSHAGAPLAGAVEHPGGVFHDATMVRIEPRLYWRPGSIHYTLDGSDPLASSPVYAEPLVLSSAKTIKTAVADAHGNLGPVTTETVDVQDDTPPNVVRVTPGYQSPLIRVEFSEPLDPSSLSPASFVLDPAIVVRAVRAGASARETVVELASAPKIDHPYHLKISGVKDISPAHNAVKPVSLDLQVKGPVFHLDSVSKAQMGSEIRDVPGLPVKGTDAWTINLRVRVDKQPASRTLIAGFGKCAQTSEGVARYLAKFQGGVHFWSHNRDVSTKTALDLGRWQMLTATYDGGTLRLYKDGQKIGERALQLSDDENAVHIAPIDPWDQKRKFEGEIEDVSIWSSALGDAAVAALTSPGSAR